jgi:hypothetical protein
MLRESPGLRRGRLAALRRRLHTILKINSGALAAPVFFCYSERMKFTAQLKYDDLGNGSNGKWSFQTTPADKNNGPCDSDLVWLLRHIADRIESDARKKLN